MLSSQSEQPMLFGKGRCRAPVRPQLKAIAEDKSMSDLDLEPLPAPHVVANATAATSKNRSSIAMDSQTASCFHVQAIMAGRLQDVTFTLSEDPAFLSWDAPHSRKTATKIMAAHLVRVVRGQTTPAFSRLPNASRHAELSFSIIYKDRFRVSICVTPIIHKI